VILRVQVHIRTKRCLKDGVTCNCAVAIREGNNALGVYACDADKPPVAIRYLDDPQVPGAQIDISPTGTDYKVNDSDFRHQQQHHTIFNVAEVMLRVSYNTVYSGL